jgi:acetyl esterase/lipase
MLLRICLFIPGNGGESMTYRTAAIAGAGWISAAVISGLVLLAPPEATASPDTGHAAPTGEQSDDRGGNDEPRTDEDAQPAEEPSADPSPVDEPEKPDGTTSARTTPKAGPDGLHTRELLRPRRVTRVSGHRASAVSDLGTAPTAPPREIVAVQPDHVETPVPDPALETGAAAVHPSRPTVQTTTAVAAKFIDKTTDRPQLRTPRSLIDAVGSVVLKMLSTIVHLLDGPPMLPAGSTVTVRTSHLTLPIGSGKAVEANWYFPKDADTSTRLIYLQHGFLASGPMYSYTAANLAERTNSIVVVPSLSSNFLDPTAEWVGGGPMHRAVADLFVGERTALNQSASTALGVSVTLPQKFVFVGHSAGGTLVTAAAGHLTDNGAIGDLAGVVMLDGVEPAGSRAVGDALAKLTGNNDVPIYLMSSDRYFWSRNGDMADKLSVARPGRFNGVGLAGGLHIDHLQGGNPLIQTSQYLLAGYSARENVAAATEISVGWVNDLFAGTATSGFYGAPHQSIPIVTSAGTATAIVLPLRRVQRSPWRELVDGFFTVIFDQAGRNAFVYEPLDGHAVAL